MAEDFSFSELAPMSVRPPLTLGRPSPSLLSFSFPCPSSEVEKREDITELWADVEVLPRVPNATAPECGAWTMPLEMVCVGAECTCMSSRPLPSRCVV